LPSLGLRLGRTALRQGLDASAKRSGNLPLEAAVAERPAAVGRRPQVRDEIRVERGTKQRAVRILAVGLGSVETPIEVVPTDELCAMKMPRKMRVRFARSFKDSVRNPG